MRVDMFAPASEREAANPAERAGVLHARVERAVEPGFLCIKSQGEPVSIERFQAAFTWAIGER